MLHIYSIRLLHLQIAKYKGFLIKIKVGFSAKLKVLKVPLGALYGCKQCYPIWSFMAQSTLFRSC